jgi:hypothetical protein
MLEAIDADRLLSPTEKKVLLDMYHVLTHSDGSLDNHTEQE